MAIQTIAPIDTLSALPDLGASPSSSTSGAPAASTSPAGSIGPTWLTGTIAQITVILLGVVLIIAGLFQFRPVQEATGAVAKGAIAA
jgi:hypothetical protein